MQLQFQDILLNFKMIKGLGSSYVKSWLFHWLGFLSLLLSLDPGIYESIWFVDLSALPGVSGLNSSHK